jgi:hypothetical protein
VALVVVAAIGKTSPDDLAEGTRVLLDASLDPETPLLEEENA